MFANSAHKSLFTLNIPTVEGFSLHLNTLHYEESLSQIDSLRINLRAADDIDPGDLLNQVLKITWNWDGIDQYYHGLITGLDIAADSEGYSIYELFCASPIFLLEGTRQSRHFIYQTLDTIVKKIIESAQVPFLNIEFHLSGENPEREFTAQHEETDLSFLERILHEVGWFYSLIHTENGVIFHVHDHAQSLPALPHPVYFQPLVQGTKPLESVYTIKDSQNELTAESDCLGMRAGQVFTLSGHPHLALNQSYTILSVTHQVDESSANLRYHNLLKLLPLHFVYRPHYEPIDRRIQTLSSAQIHSDNDSPLLNEQGEYTLRSAHTDELTHPIRLTTPYSGSHYGMHFPLHDQVQVLVAYLNGHPDKPVVLGSLFNEAHPNVVNAKNPRQNLLVTQSGHTLLLDDQPGHQKILLHTPEQTHRLLMDATQDDEKIELVSQTGQMQVKIAKSTQLLTEDHFHLTADQSIEMIAQDNVTFSSDEASMICEAALDIAYHAGQDMLWHADQNMEIRVDGNAQTTVKQSMRTEIQNGDYSVNILSGSLSHQAQKNIQYSTATGDIILKTAQASVTFKANGNIVFNAKNIFLQAQTIDIHQSGKTTEN